MADLVYKDDFNPEEFLSLARRVWPRNYAVDETAAALKRTINIGAWDAQRLVGSVRGPVSTRSRIHAKGDTVRESVRTFTLIAAMLCVRLASAQPSANQSDMSMDAKAKSETIASLAKGLREAYVFPEVGQKVAAILEARNAKGEYDSTAGAKAFSELVTRHMLDATGDRHLRVIYNVQRLPSLPLTQPGAAPPLSARELAQLRVDNFEFEKIERLSGNVGYLKLNAFVDAEHGGSVAAGAMAFLANTDALIIDLRQNGGGEPSMVTFLASYFFAGTVHLNDLAYRLEGTRDYDVTQVWTSPYVPGQRYLDRKVYILTSSRTFSAAEEFTYDLQALKRAIVVGERTVGGANPGGPYRLGDHFYAAMPRGHSINAVTKTNWEGKGITPDVDASEGDALKTARRLALQDLLEHATDPRAARSVKQALAALDAER
jgi:hypothetical protein